MDIVNGQAEQRQAKAYLAQFRNLADLESRQRQLQQRGAFTHPFFSWSQPRGHRYSLEIGMHTYGISFMGIRAVAQGNSPLVALTNYAARYPFRRGPSLKNIRAMVADVATGGGTSNEFVSPRAGKRDISIRVAQLHTYAIRFMGSTTRVWGASAEDALQKYAAQHPFRQGPVFPTIHVISVDGTTGGLVSGEFFVPALTNRPEISISVERVQ